jgi:FtsP/CotA-like multicopper oxidase with cupredoxin domain
MRVLSRNGETPPDEEKDGFAKKDTILLGPNSEVEVLFKFRDYPGPWVFHCHNIEHEDMRMMARFDVEP